jgi:hypothetical protein
MLNIELAQHSNFQLCHLSEVRTFDLTYSHLSGWYHFEALFRGYNICGNGIGTSWNTGVMAHQIRIFTWKSMTVPYYVDTSDGTEHSF